MQSPPGVRFVIATTEATHDLYQTAWLLGTGNANYDSGVDIRFPKDITFLPGEVTRVGLGVRVAMLMLHWNPQAPAPVGIRHAFDLLPRSSIAKPAKKVSWGEAATTGEKDRPQRFLTMPNAPGLIDVAYNGELMVQLVNSGSEPVHFKRGDSVVQVAAPSRAPVEYCAAPGSSPIVRRVFDEIGPQSRGAGGFGSTGAAGSA